MMEIGIEKMIHFFNVHCGTVGETLPDCARCKHNSNGCANEHNPMNKMEHEIDSLGAKIF